MATATASPQPIWLDVDAGVDDAQAIMLALLSPTVEVVGISCVSGNVHVDKVLVNVRKVLNALDRTVPLFRGVEGPLIGPAIEETAFHGLDGLGNCPAEWTERDVPVSDVHAVNAILEATRTYPAMKLIAVGPLTNIALCCRMDASFPSRVADFVVMGGSARAQGNSSMTAEFNFHADPEAAHICLQAIANTTIITWELTLEHPLSWSWFDIWIAKPTHRARFMQAICQYSLDKYRYGADKLPKGWIACDPCAVAVAIDPCLILEEERHHMIVELAGQHTRGQCVVDWLHDRTRRKNVHVVKKLDMDRLCAMLEIVTD